jgi:hypothetical protein
VINEHLQGVKYSTYQMLRRMLVFPSNELTARIVQIFGPVIRVGSNGQDRQGAMFGRTTTKGYRIVPLCGAQIKNVPGQERLSPPESKEYPPVLLLNEWRGH